MRKIADMHDYMTRVYNSIPIINSRMRSRDGRLTITNSRAKIRSRSTRCGVRYYFREHSRRYEARSFFFRVAHVLGN